MSTTDRIEKHVVLRAPRSRVWRALTNADEFGQWFRVKLEGPGRRMTLRGKIVGDLQGAYRDFVITTKAALNILYHSTALQSKEPSGGDF